MNERMRNYFYIALFAIGSVGFLFSADYVLLVNRTCFVYFDTNKSKLEKTVAKLKAKFQKGQNVLTRPVDPTLFRFTKPEEE